MSHKKIIRFIGLTTSPQMAVMVLAMLLAGALFAWWMVGVADRDQRADLLQQVRLVAQGVDLNRVQTLSGTAADQASPDYRQLKAQLAATCSVNPRCRFIYLMDRRADGEVFFLVDSEPTGGENSSPPGQIYEDATAELRRLFDTKEAFVEGPLPDRWGVWVSALLPLIDPQTGEMAAVLGMDIDASLWQWDVAARAVLPVGLMWVLLIGVVTAFAATYRADASPKPVLRRMLAPLTIILFLLVTGAGVLLWHQNQQQIAANMATLTTETSNDLKIVLEQQALGLATAAQFIAADTEVQQNLRQGNTDRLQATWQPMFESMNRENRLTHFYFYDKNRVCILRLHQLERRGDLINRITAVEAERTGQPAAGIELGPQGRLNLRTVQPVYTDGELVGYVELGRDIEEVLQTLHLTWV